MDDPFESILFSTSHDFYIIVVPTIRLLIKPKVNTNGNLAHLNPLSPPSVHNKRATTEFGGRGRKKREKSAALKHAR